MLRTSRATLTVVGVLTMTLVAPHAPGAASASARPPTCFGKPATIVGTPGDDQLFDTPGHGDAEVIHGRDVVVTLGGDDRVRLKSYTPRVRICLGAGDDREASVNGTGNGGLWVDGGPGADSMVDRTDYDDDAPGTRRIYGGPGDDLLGGESSRDVLVGGGGEDFAFGLEGDDLIRMGGGADRAEGFYGSDKLSGGRGDDRLVGSFLNPDGTGEGPDTGKDKVNGGPGLDRCEGEDKRNCEA